MKAIIYVSYFLLFSTLSFAQKVTYSEIQREDSREISFEIIGKIKENIFIFKNARYKYNLSVYNAEDMELKEKVDLDFIPEKSFNVDYVSMPDNFYFIYQYLRKGVVYCMGAKMDLNGHYRAKTPRRALPKCAQSLLLQQLADPAPEPL